MTNGRTGVGNGKGEAAAELGDGTLVRRSGRNHAAFSDTWQRRKGAEPRQNQGTAGTERILKNVHPQGDLKKQNKKQNSRKTDYR